MQRFTPSQELRAPFERTEVGDDRHGSFLGTTDARLTAKSARDASISTSTVGPVVKVTSSRARAMVFLRWAKGERFRPHSERHIRTGV